MQWAKILKCHIHLNWTSGHHSLAHVSFPFQNVTVIPDEGPLMEHFSVHFRQKSRWCSGKGHTRVLFPEDPGSTMLDFFQFCARISQEVIWQALTGGHPVATCCLLPSSKTVVMRQHFDQWEIRRNLLWGLMERLCFLLRRKSQRGKLGAIPPR